MQYVVEIVAYDATLPGTRTLYYSQAGFVSASGDTPASTYFEARLQQPALMRRDVFSQGTTGGKSSVGYGELVLTNPDGGLDDLIEYGMDGRTLTLRLGEGAYPSGWTTVLKGTMEQPQFSWGRVSIRIRDRQEELARPIQANKFAGNNSLPNGLEGVAGDLKGKPKPLTYGSVYNVRPPCVNTSKLIYQVNDGAINDVPAAYDRAVPLTQGANYASQADLLNNALAPAAGFYKVYPAGGMFRLGSSPKGELTCDVLQGANAAARTVAQLVYQIVTGPGGIATGDVSSGDITALDTANSSVVGVYVDSETDMTKVLDDLANSIGAWWGFDSTGVFRIKQFTAPSGTAVVDLTQKEIVTIERVATADTDKGVPAYRVVLGYQKNYTVQDGREIAGTAATDVYRGFIAQEYRTVTDTDTAVQTAHLMAPQVEKDTLLTVEANAQTEATRLLTLYKTRRDRLNVRVHLDAATAALVDLGSVVSVTIPRYGYDSGKLFRVLGLQYDARINALDLTLWG